MQIDRSRRHARALAMLMAYESGAAIEEIADRFESSRTTVLRYARMANLPKRPKHFPPELKDGVIAMYQLGRPVAEIAAHYGVSEAYVSTTARAAGLSRYRRTTQKEADHANG